MSRSSNRTDRYRKWYSRLLRLYPVSYRKRFQTGLEQTFADLCRENEEAGRWLPGMMLWATADTFGHVIKENLRIVAMNYSNVARLAILTGLILLVPLVAMRFTSEVVWTISDFVVAGALLFGSGLAYQLISARSRNSLYKVAVGLTVGVALFLIWSNLAVGLIGSEDNPINLIYLGVLAVGVAGTLRARFRPLGMSRALYITAAVQMLVAVIAQIAGQGPTYLVNGFFAFWWIAAAWLFQRAASMGLESH